MKYNMAYEKCPDCNHIWILITDQLIDTWLYTTWIIGVWAEHKFLKDERNNNEDYKM